MPKRAAKAAAKAPSRSRSSSAARSGDPSDAVDEQLARYRAMRDFAMTAEPRGTGEARASDPKSAASDLPFVVQKHAATRLHYDFRLGWRGVLKSWAVTKGPSYHVGDKRLAVEVEDHPIEYGGFEGTIPKGQYGGGTVMVWDQGTWEPVLDVDEGLKKGHLKFILHGHKLKGHWALIRMHPREHDTKPNWLLIKEHDEFERPADAEAITEEAPDSAVTGRSLQQIAADEDHVWNSNRPEKQEPKNFAEKLAARNGASEKNVSAAKAPVNRSRLKASKKAKPDAEPPNRESVLRDAPKEKLPSFISPELAIHVEQPPEGDEWLHELKLDGYRIQAHIDEQGKGAERRVRLFTRSGLDWTHRMPAVAEAAAKLNVRAAILDGEVVVVTENGGTSFAELQAAFDEGAPNPLTCFAFDLLHLDGHNLRKLPLERRKTILEGLLQELGDSENLRYSSHLRAQGGAMFQQACQMGAEGVVSKLASSPYESKRSRAWLKSKCVLQQELVVGGYTPLSNGSPGVGSLLLGYYQGGKFIYAGRTGTGFNQQTRELLEDRLKALRQAKPSYEKLPSDAKKDAVWVKPEVVVEVRFATWTGDHLVRQAAFLGLREDKDPKEVAREDAAPIPKHPRKTNQKRDAQADADAEPAQPTEPEQEKAKPAPAPIKASASTKASATARASASAPKRPTRGGRLDVAGVSLSHPDKILDAESKLTKQQLAEYYAAVADHLLPHIADRPLSIVRCPEGSGKPCFFQKHIGMGVPSGIGSVPVTPKNSGKPEEYLTLSTVEGLVGLAQMGVLEVHPWGSRNETLEQPDRIIIDLDPDTALPWKQLVDSAVEVRGLLSQLGLETWVKSTGGKGLHVVAPIQPRREWPEIKEFAHQFVLMMERANPKLYLTKMTKAARTGKIFLDYLRNERGATAVAAWSPRARIGARVAVPLTWQELERSQEAPRFSVSNFSEWKSRLKRDPWLDMEKKKQQVTDKAIAAIGQMLAQK